MSTNTADGTNQLPNEGKESGKKRKKKRKAKSPLLDSGQTGQTSTCVGGVSVNKRQNLIDNDLMASPVNTINTMNQNQNQNQTASPGQVFPQYPYNMQMPHPPPQFYQPAQDSMPPPPWANQLIEDMQLVKQSIPKIDNIEKTVKTISMKINDLETKMKTMDSRILETEKACSFINESSEKQKSELEKTKKEITNLKSSCEKLNETVTSLESEKQKISSKLTDMESRSMRDNLLFYGIEENSSENCEELVKECIKQHLKIEGLTFDRVHRLGPTLARKPRPIVAKFHYSKERETVRQTSITERDTLKSKGYGIGIQYPKETRDIRKILYPIMKQAENNGKRARLVNDKLYIDGVLYNHENTKAK